MIMLKIVAIDKVKKMFPKMFLGSAKVPLRPSFVEFSTSPNIPKPLCMNPIIRKMPMFSTLAEARAEENITQKTDPPFIIEKYRSDVAYNLNTLIKWFFLKRQELI